MLGLRLSVVAIVTKAESVWSVTLYDHGLNALVELSPSGEHITPLPDVNYQPRPFESISQWYMDFATSVKMTDDRRYLVSIAQQNEAIITDLATNETRPVAIPSLEEEEIFILFHFGAFNTEMTEVALPYVSHDLTSGSGCCDSGGIITVDLTSGAIVNRLDIDSIYNASTAWVDYWTSEGIWFSPRCSTCTPPNTYTYQVWNPETVAIVDTDVFNDNQYSERLIGTGELLYSENNLAFPLGGVSFPLRLNVVALYQPGDYPPDTDGQIVYYDGENLDFDVRAHWIMGGRAFLVTKNLQHNVIVFRDGQNRIVDYDSMEFFVAMTDDGWLTIDRTTNTIRHYTASNEVISGQPLYQALGEIIVVNKQLQETREELSPFSVEISPPDVVFCPGALPTRLQPGDWAETLYYDPASVFGSFFIGDVEVSDISYDNHETLPLGAHVRILEGPVCAPYGGTYVKVAYQGVIGWLLEIYQTGYFLAPVSIATPNS
jgi:hypothetical protein